MHRELPSGDQTDQYVLNAPRAERERSDEAAKRAHALSNNAQKEAPVTPTTAPMVASSDAVSTAPNCSLSHPHVSYNSLPNPGLSPSLEAAAATVEAVQHRPAIVCAMDHLTTKLRIPVRFVVKTHACPQGTDAAAREGGAAATPTSRQHRDPMSGSTQLADANPTLDALENSRYSVDQQNHQQTNVVVRVVGVDDSTVHRHPQQPQGPQWVQDPNNNSVGTEGNNSSLCINNNSGFGNMVTSRLHSHATFAALGGNEPTMGRGADRTTLMRNILKLLKGGVALPTPPSICRLFQESKCRQGARCHQVHIQRNDLDGLRTEAKARGLCCWEHDYPSRHTSYECDDPAWSWKTCLVCDALCCLQDVAIVGSSTDGTDSSASLAALQRHEPSTQLSLPRLGEGSSGLADHNLNDTPPHVDTSLELSLSSAATPSAALASSRLLPDTSQVLAPSATTAGGARSASSRDTPTQRDPRLSLRPSQVSPTLGLCISVIRVFEHALQAQPVSIDRRSPDGPLHLDIPFESLCRGHLRGPVCKFGDQCRYIHVCRLVHSSLAAPPSRHPGSRALPTTGRGSGRGGGDSASPEHAPTASPGGSGILYSSHGMMGSFSSGTRPEATAVVTSDSSGSQREQQLRHPGHNRRQYDQPESDELVSHILLTSPQPPPPNVRVKMWQNMPYKFPRDRGTRPKDPPDQGR